MLQDNPRILIISSCSLSMGPAAIAGQYYDALKRAGADVDLLLKEQDPCHPEFLHVFKIGYDKSIWFRLKRKIRWMFSILSRQRGEYCFFYKKEIHPPVSSKLVLKQINKPYDLVMIVFWQGLLSFESIDCIYEKLHCQIQFMVVDYSHMSGGCHFTGDCQRYKIGCGCCPAFSSNDKNDFTAWNVQFRKKVYEKVRPVVYGNHYMMDFYKQSYLLKNVQCEMNHSAIIDTDVFKPLDVVALRKKYFVPREKKFIIFFACQSLEAERKGMKFLIEALEFLHKELSEKSSEFLILMAGHGYEKVSSLMPFDSMGVGYVPMNVLPELFTISTLFVCPSVDDAGPMMVGQSLCCATPVVGFDMGSVRQLVKDQGTGVCIPLKDSKALAAGIESIFRMPAEDYALMSSRCRNVALKYCSYEAQANRILDTYYKYKNGYQ